MLVDKHEELRQTCLFWRINRNIKAQILTASRSMKPYPPIYPLCIMLRMRTLVQAHAECRVYHSYHLSPEKHMVHEKRYLT
jgi:hypothetical protein